jgi:hypothetical protein
VFLSNGPILSHLFVSTNYFSLKINHLLEAVIFSRRLLYMFKKNCWEHKACGRQPGGDNTEGLGVCPVTTHTKAHGLNDGINGGRACWAIEGTLCGGEVQGTYAQKMGNCMDCDF